MTDEPAWGIRRDDRGVNGLGKLEDGKRVRVVLIEPHVSKATSRPLDDLREALVAVYGTDFGVHDVTWLSRFTDTTRQAASYRERRVLLAGDAAHVHSPAGGQGLNIGVQDAVNLGWKLAQVVSGTSPESLLDTYQAERHPIGARVLRTTMAQTALNRGDERTKALRETMSELLQDGRASQAIRRDDVGARHSLRPRHGHPLLGRRMPDLDLVTEERSAARVHAAARRPPGAAQSRRARRPRHRVSPGRTGLSGSTLDTRACGSSRCSARSRSHRRVDPARRIRRVGRRRHRPGPSVTR